MDSCKAATEDLLKELETLSYQVSAKKAQLCTQEATYLGYKLQEGNRTLSTNRIRAILDIPRPQTKKQVWEFLGAIGYCRLWILGFTEVAKPLYAATGGKDPHLQWGHEEEKAFKILKQALVSAPALALPDLSKPFYSYVAENKGIAKGVLTQTLGPWKRPFA